MNIELNDNFKWFLESLLNEGFDEFFIDDMYGAVFTKNGRVTSIDNVNFITSNFYKSCSKLEENINYSIKDFIEGKLSDNNFEFGDKIIVTINGKKYDAIFLKKEDNHNVVIIKGSDAHLCINNRAIKKAE